MNSPQSSVVRLRRSLPALSSLMSSQSRSRAGVGVGEATSPEVQGNDVFRNGVARGSIKAARTPQNSILDDDEDDDDDIL